MKRQPVWMHWRATAVLMLSGCGAGVWSDPGLAPESNQTDAGSESGAARTLPTKQEDQVKISGADTEGGEASRADVSSYPDVSIDADRRPTTEAGEHDGDTSDDDANAEHVGNDVADTDMDASSLPRGDDWPDGGDGAPADGDRSEGDASSADDAALEADGAARPLVDPGMTRPSCTQLATRCGSARDSCCTGLLVPSGTFNLGGTLTTPITSASVSDYYLDEYEVTVGRFREFLSQFDEWRAAGNPVDGAGAHPLIAGSGWQSHWNDYLEQHASDAVDASAYCQMRNWDGDDAVPVNCVTWYEAFAFCLWDNARLPTDAEWEYAAAGGSENRIYSWGSAPPDGRAVYGCLGDGFPGCYPADMLPVGSMVLGTGKWGQYDLIGSMFEWVLDRMNPYPKSCNDCASVAAGTFRLQRGSGWSTDMYPGILIRRDYIDEGAIGETTSAVRLNDLGLRCARTPASVVPPDR